MNKRLLALLLISGSSFGIINAQTKLIKSEFFYNDNLQNSTKYGYIGNIKSITPLKGNNLIENYTLDLSNVADSVLEKQSNGEYKLRTLISYNNQLAPVKKVYYSQSTGSISSSILYTYHNNGVLSQELRVNSDSTNVEETNYDNAGRMLAYNTYNVNGVDTFMKKRTILYDNDRLKRDYTQILKMPQGSPTWSLDSIEYYYQSANIIADSVYSYRKSVSPSNMLSAFVLEGKRYISYNNLNDTLVDSTYFDYGYSSSSLVINYIYSGDTVILEQKSLDRNDNPILIPTYRIKSVDTANGDINEATIIYRFFVPENKIKLDYAGGYGYDANGYLKEIHAFNEDSLGNLVRYNYSKVYRNSDNNIDSITYPDSKFINYYDNTTSINVLSKNTFKIYPNPSNGIFNIESAEVISFNTIVYDGMGRLVGAFNQTNQIDLTHQPSGHYIFRITDHKTNDTYIYQLIKNK